MNAVLAFTIIMLVWAISDFISKKTKSKSILIKKTEILPPFKHLKNLQL